MKLPLITKREDSPLAKARQSPDGVMTLTEHLAELRIRIIRSVLAVLIGAIVIVAFYDQVLDFLTTPYANLCASKPPEFCGPNVDADGNVSLYAFSPLAGLGARMKVAGYGGVILAIPVLMWQLWRFIVPALQKNEKKYAVPFILSSVTLFLMGAVLAYITLEPALDFLISWAGDSVTAMFEVTTYLSLVGLMAGAFGVGFQFPVLLVFLQLINILTPQQLLRFWRYALVIVVILAAVITPSGDPISLAMLSVPMYLLYFAAIAIGVVIQRRRHRP